MFYDRNFVGLRTTWTARFGVHVDNGPDTIRQSSSPIVVQGSKLESSSDVTVRNHDSAVRLTVWTTFLTRIRSTLDYRCYQCRAHRHRKMTVRNKLTSVCNKYMHTRQPLPLYVPPSTHPLPL